MMSAVIMISVQTLQCTHANTAMTCTRLCLDWHNLCVHRLMNRIALVQIIFFLDLYSQILFAQTKSLLQNIVYLRECLLGIRIFADLYGIDESDRTCPNNIFSQFVLS